jgi:hypothetical protein
MPARYRRFSITIDALGGKNSDGGKEEMKENRDKTKRICIIASQFPNILSVSKYLLLLTLLQL